MKLKILLLSLVITLGSANICVAQSGNQDPSVAGATNFFYGQKTVTTSATNVLPTIYPGQRGWILRNTDATNPIYIGADASTTSSTGFLVKAGETISLPLKTGLWMISTGGSVNICWIATCN